MGHPPPEIDVRLTAEPIPPSLPSPPPGPSCGVVLEFRRIARQTRDGGPMRYVVYEKMALSKMTEIATALAHNHAALGLTLIHRHGPVQAGETVVYVAVRAHTRSAAVACLNDLVDVVKRDAPIWRIGG